MTGLGSGAGRRRPGRDYTATLAELAAGLAVALAFAIFGWVNAVRGHQPAPPAATPVVSSTPRLPTRHRTCPALHCADPRSPHRAARCRRS